MAAGWISGRVNQFLAPAIEGVIASAAGYFPPAMQAPLREKLKDFSFDVYLLRARKYAGKGWKLRGIELLQIGRQDVGRTSDQDAAHQGLVGTYPAEPGVHLGDSGIAI